MRKTSEKTALLLLTLYLLSVCICPLGTYASSYGFVHIDELTSTLSVSGYVDEYIPGVDEVYLVIPSLGKTFEDFASSGTSELLGLNMAYLDVVPVERTGRFSASFRIAGIDEGHEIHLSYNGKNIPLNSDDVAKAQKILHITGTLDYVDGCDTVQIKILRNGYTYEDYLTYGDEVVFGTYSSVLTDKNGGYEFYMEDTHELFGSNVIITSYADKVEYRTIQNSEFVVKIYVDGKNGDDTNSGFAKETALKTIDEAQKLYLKKYADDGYSGHIIIGEGTYGALNIEGSPAEGATLTYEGVKGEDVVLTSGTRLALSDFGRITDADILDRIQDVAKDGVYCLDLNKYGITADDIFGNHDDYRKSCELEMASLYLNGTPQSVAKWPNGSYAQSHFFQYEVDKDNDIYTYTFDAENAKNWANADVENTYLEGFFTPDKNAWVRNYAEVLSIDAQNKKIIFDAPDSFRGSSVTAGTEYYHSALGYNLPCRYGKITVCHLLEEMDIPGEWYVDADTMKLYYYMPQGVTDSDELVITAFDENVISADAISDVTFENLTISGSGGELVYFASADNVTIRNCILNDGQYGIVIESGRNNIIDGNAIYYIKGNAVWIKRGAQDKTLTPSANRITNNHIYNCAIAGVHGGICADENIRLGYYQNNNALIGEVIENNVIHGNPYGEAVTYIGMEHSIRYNEFYNLTNYMADVGVVYTGNKLGQYGTHIDYNYFHDFEHELTDTTKNGSTPPSDSSAIYWDDYHSGQSAQNNIIVADGTQKSRGLLEVGKNNTANYNLTVNANKGFLFGDRGADLEDIAATTYKSFDSVTDAVAQKYPQIMQSKADIDATGKFEPTGNNSHGNMTVDVPNLKSDSTVFTEAGSHTGDFNLTTGYFTNTSSTDSNGITTAKTKLGYSDIFVDHINHDWRLKSSFVAQYSGKISDRLLTEDNFDMSVIGMKYNVYNEDNPADTSFNLTYPLNIVFEDTDTVSIAWEKALFADRYYYEVATSPSFDGASVVFSGYTKYNAAEVPNLKKNIRYYWRVSAYCDSKDVNTSRRSDEEYGVFTISEFDYSVKNVKFYDEDDNRIASIVDIDKAAYVTYDIVNKTDSETDYVIILALYNQEMTRLKHILVKESGKSGVGTINHTSVITGIQKENSVKDDMGCIFLWSDTQSMAPLGRKISIK